MRGVVGLLLCMVEDVERDVEHLIGYRLEWQVLVIVVDVEIEIETDYQDKDARRHQSYQIIFCCHDGNVFKFESIKKSFPARETFFVVRVELHIHDKAALHDEILHALDNLEFTVLDGDVVAVTGDVVHVVIAIAAGADVVVVIVWVRANSVFE